MLAQNHITGIEPCSGLNIALDPKKLDKNGHYLAKNFGGPGAANAKVADKHWLYAGLDNRSQLKVNVYHIILLS